MLSTASLTPRIAVALIMAVGSQKIVAEIAERICERRRIYDSALAADMTLLQERYGASAVLSALELLKSPPANNAKWNQAAHAREVERAIGNLLRGRAENADEFNDSLKI
jgi:hypothetical protein